MSINPCDSQTAEPLDGDDIRQRIYAAGAAIGRADPFLASELTDGVMHFLRYDGNLAALAKGNAGTIATLVRELGHPRIAQEMNRLSEEPGSRSEPLFAAAPTPDDVANHWLTPQLREYSGTHVYPTNLAAAHEIGLLSIDDMDCPFELYGGVIEPIAHGPNPELALVEVAVSARNKFGKFMVFHARDTSLAPDAFANALNVGLRFSGRTALVHLSRDLVCPTTSQSPSLFVSSAGESDEVISVWLRMLTSPHAIAARIVPVVHITAEDIESRLGPVLQSANEFAPRIIIALDRPNTPAWLADGLDERLPALLGRVTLRLPQLFTELDPKPSAEVFLKKLGSFARLALAAGHAKMAHLRRFGGSHVSGGFLLERAGLAVNASGIEAVASTLTRDRGEDDRNNYAKLMREKLRSALLDVSPRAIPTSFVESHLPVSIDRVPQIVFGRGTAINKLTTHVSVGILRCVNEVRTALSYLARHSGVCALDVRFSTLAANHDNP